MDTNQYLKDGKIDVSTEGIKYWSEKLQCSEKNLSEAIYKLGNSYTALTLYLEMNHMINKPED